METTKVCLSFPEESAQRQNPIPCLLFAFGNYFIHNMFTKISNMNTSILKADFYPQTRLIPEL